MATFITTIRFTEQGVKNVRQTAQRAAAFEATARQLGASVTHVYWTLGGYDGLLVFDAADDEAAAVLMLRLGSLGNVHTQTCRAFTASDMTKLLANV